MKWCRTMVVFDQSSWIMSPDWADIHASYLRSIAAISHPATPGLLTIRERVRKPDGKYQRNGVGYMHKAFIDHLVTVEKWSVRKKPVLKPSLNQRPLIDYPSLLPHEENVTSAFGSFDVLQTSKNGTRTAIEWETGNISSSHRSLNKLTMCLAAGSIDIGVLIVPSRDLYKHLTDRIGNIGELSPYLDFWEQARAMATAGMLAITVVEHDVLTQDGSIDFLKVGMDGNAGKVATMARSKKTHAATTTATLPSKRHRTKSTD